MRKAKYSILLCMLAAALLLSGCQLAREEKEYSQDRLVGISVRIENSFDSGSGEGYFDRRQPHEPDGALVWLKTGYDENGVPMSGAEYDEDGWFDPVHLHFTTTDEGEEHALETTLYLAEELLPEHALLQMEHVYQREDGTLYAINGGSNYSGDMDGLGLKVSSSYATTFEGEKKSKTISIKLNVKYEKIVLSAEAIEMKGTGEELARHALTGQEEIWVSSDTEWVLIEETLSGGVIRRTSVNGPLDKETFVVRTANEQGICIRRSYRLRVSGGFSGEVSGT